MRIVLLLLILLGPCCAFAMKSSIALAHVQPDISDQLSLERGAKFYVNNCMSCHAMKYLRYDEFARKNGLIYEKMPIKEPTWTFGVAPPDLSLIARVRGLDWLYTYLHSFYKDTERPSGANNLLVPKTAMPNILQGYQGTHVLLSHKDTKEAQGLYHPAQWYTKLKLVSKGAMTSEQFNQTMTDLVNFMDYASEPHKLEREHLGWWVLGFLLFFTILAYLLKREFWRDVK